MKNSKKIKSDYQLVEDGLPDTDRKVYALGKYSDNDFWEVQEHVSSFSIRSGWGHFGVVYAWKELDPMLVELQKKYPVKNRNGSLA